MKFEYSKKNSINIPTPNFMKIRSVEAELFHADGRMDRQTDRLIDWHDMTELIVALGNFAKAP